MLNPMPIFRCYVNGEFLDFISAVSLRQAQARARRRYGRRVDVIGVVAPCERVSTHSSYSRTGPALV